MASALPSHLKPAASGNTKSNGDGEGAFARKHHGKSQSHVVSWRHFLMHESAGNGMLGVKTLVEFRSNSEAVRAQSLKCP